MARYRKVEPTEEQLRLLSKFNFSALPEVFALQTGEGVIQEREPCYRCTSPGFYGRGTEGTYYDEGSIIVYDSIPNASMEPLNLAAALEWITWAESLPSHRASIDITDLAEAASRLRNDPRINDLPPGKYEQAVIKLAEELKLIREGRDARSLPQLGHNFTNTTTTKAPLLGAKMSDMSQRGPGETHFAPVGINELKGGARRAGAPKAVMGGSTPIPR